MGAFALATLAVSAAVSAQSARFPFVVSYGGATNATSVAHFLDAPAGKHGFVRVRGGEFVTDAGPIRFNGTNLTGPANFPKHADADKLAARLSRLGINCVRLHYMDTWYKPFMPDGTRAQGILDDDTTTQRKLSPSQLDKLDYLVAALKKAGIYVRRVACRRRDRDRVGGRFACLALRDRVRGKGQGEHPCRRERLRRECGVEGRARLCHEGEDHGTRPCAGDGRGRSVQADIAGCAGTRQMLGARTGRNAHGHGAVRPLRRRRGDNPAPFARMPYALV